MADSSRQALLNILAKLDQLEAGNDLIHAACVSTTLIDYADKMREGVWEMRGAIEQALGCSPPFNGED